MGSLNLLKRLLVLFVIASFPKAGIAGVTFQIVPGNDDLSIIAPLLDDAPTGLAEIGRFNVGEGFLGKQFEIGFDDGLRGYWHIEGFAVYAVVIKGGPDFLLAD